jgi:ligand-binding sensor domain-containing protein
MLNLRTRQSDQSLCLIKSLFLILFNFSVVLCISSVALCGLIHLPLFFFTSKKEHALNLSIASITMLKRTFTATAFFLLFAFCCPAQIPSQLIFSRVTKKDGLASNTTFQTVRDKQGFLWIATQNGLQRYDGNRFLTFRHIPGNAASISGNSINHLFIDSKERLWLLFDKQLGLFNTAHFNFTEIKTDSTINMIKKIMEDGQGRLLLFADNKQFIYDEVKQSFASNYPLPALPAGYTIGDMVVDPATGLYWFTGKQGSILYDPKTKQFISKEQSTLHDPALDSLGPVKNARYPFIDKDGIWWMVNWMPFTALPPVLYSYDKKKNELRSFEKIRAYKTDSYYEIWNVFQQSNGTIWIYGMGLLAYYNTEEKRFIHINSDPFQQNGIDYDYVSSLYEDKEKNVWVCTNGGLYRFNVDAQVFRNIPNKRLNDTTKIYNAVSSVVETRDHGIWVSTWGAGIFAYNQQLQPIPNPVTTADPLNKELHSGCMIQRRNGEVWIGTQTGALKIYDPAADKCYSVSHSLLKGETITQLLEDRNDNIWIGSTSGLLVKCEKGNWKDTTHSFKSMRSEAGDILKLYEDSRDHLWICTATFGLYEMDTRTGKVIKQFDGNPDKNEGLLNDGATDIIQYNDSIFLIASDGLCILNSRTNQFKYLLAADGLPAEHITNLVLDKQKRLWVACDGGLYRLNIDNKLYVTYDAADGITNDIFQVSGATVLQDGRIAITTPHDFLVFDPEKIIDRKEVPAATITGFILGTARLSVDSLQKLDELTLSYNSTFISIELSTLNFRDQYYMYYMLEGLDKTWKRVSNNEITYQYLPTGDYTLKLKTTNGDGVESKTITMLRITVKPPFWKTWWFYTLLVLLVAGLLFWIDHTRIKRKTAILKMRSHIADGLHQDINAALGNITILSEMAKMKADKEPEKSKEFIEQIHTNSQDMTVAMDDILWSIDPSNDSMENFMLRFRECLDALRNKYNVQIALVVDKKAENLQLKMKIRNDVFWLFKNGITNVVKIGATNCSIHIHYEKPNLVYTLEFDTAAMDIKQLNNLRQRNELSAKLEELDARLDFKEDKANAVFVLSIPVKRDGL